MMNDIAIKVENLSKVYKLYEHPIDRLKESLHPFGKKYHHDYYALDNINFEIRRGETVGIIGRNGAGKSTLLKIITGVLTPSSGSVQVNGRIASLLELGAGFNPEMSGLENIYFSGTIMGFTHEEMKTKLEAILSFADIGEFIHQPVKTYSSGMYVRLAFAINTVIEPDILIIDEALAVGDMLFVQKCMRFVREFKSKGTILFVSHDIGSIKNLCDRGLFLNESRIIKYGKAENVINHYLDYIYAQDYSNQPIQHCEDMQLNNDNSISCSKNFFYKDNFNNCAGFKTGNAEIVSLSINNLNSNKLCLDYESGDFIELQIVGKANEKLDNPILGFILKDKLGQELFGENSIAYTGDSRYIIEKNTVFEAMFSFKFPRLQNGQYVFMLSLAEGDNYEHIQHHLIHDAHVINVNSTKITFGLVNIEFEKIEFYIHAK